MDGSLFPRKKADKSFQFSEKRKNFDKRKKDDELFKDHDGTAKKKQKRHHIRFQEDAQLETKVEFNNSVDVLNEEALQEDMLILGKVEKIKKYALVVSLPNALTGQVAITSISSSYNKELQKFASTGGDQQSPPTLHDLFKVGSFVVGKIKNIKPRESKTPVITLTLNPTELHSEFLASHLQNNMLITAAVESIEDHGYIMDVGISGLTGFLTKKDVPQNTPIFVGQLILCSVDLNENQSNTRTLSLTALPKQLTKRFLENSIAPTLQLLPGSLLSATITKITPKGLLGKCKQGNIAANVMYFSEPFVNRDVYQLNQTVKCRVLYTQPITKVVYVTLQTPHLQLSTDAQFGGLRFGDFVEEAKVERRAQTKIIFEVNKSLKGILKSSAAGCRDLAEMKERFSMGSVHRLRINKLCVFDNVLSLTSKETFFEKEIIHLEDIPAGRVLKCCVRKYQLKGLSVTVGVNTRGFIPKQYLDKSADGFKKTFNEGDILTCKVLKTDFDKKLIVLSNRSEMVSSNLPIISCFEDASPGMVTQGCVSKVLPKGFIIAFYNDYAGLYRKTLGSCHRALTPGEIVTCTVQNCYPETKKITVLLDGFYDDTQESLMNEDELFQIGSITHAKILKKSDEGFGVQILSSGVKAFLPVHHLSDYPDHWTVFLKIYQVGDVIEVLCFSKTISNKIVTMRNCFIEWARNNELITSQEDMKLGMVMPLIITGVEKFGLFVMGFGDVKGLVYIANISRKHLVDISDSKQYIYKTVIGKVNQKKDSKVGFSIKPEDCRLPQDSIATDFLKRILYERQIISQHLQERGNDHHTELCSLKCGSVINFAVSAVPCEGGYEGIFNDIKCFVSKENSGGVLIEEGETVPAVVLSLNFDKPCLHVSLDKEIILDLSKAVSAEKSFISPMLNQVARFEQLLVNENYVMGLANFNSIKSVAYFFPKRHINEGADLYGLRKKNYSIKVKSIHPGFVIAERLFGKSLIPKFPSSAGKSKKKKVAYKLASMKKKFAKLKQNVKNSVLKNKSKSKQEDVKVETNKEVSKKTNSSEKLKKQKQEPKNIPNDATKVKKLNGKTNPKSKLGKLLEKPSTPNLDENRVKTKSKKTLKKPSKETKSEAKVIGLNEKSKEAINKSKNSKPKKSKKKLENPTKKRVKPKPVPQARFIISKGKLRK